jgi:transposase
MSYPLEVREQFIKLRVTGLSYDKISAEIDVPVLTLKQWGNIYQKEILEIEFEQAVDLMERCHMNRPSALEKSVVELEKINTAITAKDFMNEDLKTLLKIREKNEIDIINMVNSTRKSLERCNNNDD